MKIVLHYPDIIADEFEPLLRQNDITDYIRVWGVSEEQLAEKVAGAEILLSMSASKSVIEKGFPTLKLIHSFGIGVNRIDLQAAKKNNVTVAHTTGNVAATAEHAFALLLACAKKIVPADKTFRENRWVYGFAGRKYSYQLSGKILAIIGLGRVGRLVAQFGRSFGMKVIGVRRSGRDIQGIKVYPPDRLLEVLGIADYIVVALVSTPST
ncbi:MAG: NAD(P)-dependent oxidoreductase, partial [Candidatus Ranarchaeia archaeon]